MLRRPVPSFLASLALATAAWTGHAGATEAGQGALHRASDVLHLLAAATWLGALVLFLAAALGGRNKGALIRHLTGLQYTRNGSELRRGTYRVRGEVIDVHPAESEDEALRIELFDGEIEQLSLFDNMITREDVVQCLHGQM